MKKHESQTTSDHYIPRPEYMSLNTDRQKVPFMLKILTGKLHAGAKANGKKLVWSKKPIKKKEIDIEIPKYMPNKVYNEEFHSRSLSGGQWQRIALARTFMKIKEADLLILDEPSSALDPQAEYQVFKSLMELRKNRTTIFIVCIPQEHC
jgi:ABC-type dipeptide/oligopeptide/nickel transport system ATPase subunit